MKIDEMKETQETISITEEENVFPRLIVEGELDRELEYHIYFADKIESEIHGLCVYSNKYPDNIGVYGKFYNSNSSTFKGKMRKVWQLIIDDYEANKPIAKQWYEDESNFPALVIDRYGRFSTVINSEHQSIVNNSYRLATKQERDSLYVGDE